MHIQRKSLLFIRFTSDLLMIIMSFILAMDLTIKPGSYWIDMNNQVLFYSLIITWIVSTRVTGLYDEFRSNNFIYELITVIKNIFIQSLCAVVILFLLEKEIMTKFFVVAYSTYMLLLMVFEKFFFRQLMQYLRKKGKNLRSILIVGAGDLGYNFCETINENPHFGYKIIGFVDDESKSFLNGQYLGKIEDLERVLDEKSVDDVIVALPNYATEQLQKVIMTCEHHTTRIKIIPNYFKYIPGKFNVSMFGRFPIISVRDDRLNELHWRILKRGFDLAFTSVLFVFAFSWLWPLIALAVKLSSPGPVFFKQIRWGRDNNRFVTYKFRSMRVDSHDVDENGNFLQATRDDPRVTKLGKFLRKTNLDELPQFLNVLAGDMSIVGPRPHPTPLNIESKDRIHLYMLRHLVKPGITGWAQVNGLRGQTSGNSELMQKRVDHDIWYIENWSFTLDIQIIFTTVWKMIKGDPDAY